MTPKDRFKVLWKIEYHNFFDDLEKFILEWETKLKECKCENPECKHYQREKIKRFGNRTDNLFNSSLLMNGKSFIEIQQKAH